jgi:hypothetical protein
MKVFTDGVRQFAATNGLHACQNKYDSIWTGPSLCSYKSEQLQIQMFGMRPLDDCFDIRMAPTEVAHMSSDEFASRAEALLKSLQARFPERLKVERKVWFEELLNR